MIQKFGGDLLSSYLKLLNNNFKYSVLRNYEKLPFENDSKDVDILIDPNYFKEAFVLLLKLSKTLNYKTVWKNELDYLTGVSFAKVVENTTYSVKIDLFNGLLWRGMTYIDVEELFNKSRIHNEFRVLNKGHEAFVMIIYYLLYAKNIRKKYNKLIFSNANIDLIEFKRVVHLNFKEQIGNKIIYYVENNKIDKLVSLRTDIRNSIFLRSLTEVKFVKRFYFHFKSEYYDRRKMGKVVVFSDFEGADNCKSINQLLDLFSEMGISKKKRPYHFLLSKNYSGSVLYRLLRKLNNQDDKHRNEETLFMRPRLIGCTSNFMSYLYDNFFILRKELRGNNIVFFHGHYLDLIFERKMKKNNFNRRWCKYIFRFLPKPDLMFITVGKQANMLSMNLSIEKNKSESLLKYKNFEFSLSNCYVIDKSYYLAEDRTNLYNFILDKLEEIHK